MKKIKHIKFISSLLSLVMLITSAGIAPIKSMAADSDNGENLLYSLRGFVQTERAMENLTVHAEVTGITREMLHRTKAR